MTFIATIVISDPTTMPPIAAERVDDDDGMILAKIERKTTVVGLFSTSTFNDIKNIKVEHSFFVYNFSRNNEF